MRALLLALALVSASVAADLPDPLPLRRVPLGDKPEAKLKEAADGALVRMKRADFEKLVQDAARAAPGREPPRLIEARYRAALTDSFALAGTLQWKLRHPGAGPALLRLGADASAFNLALRGPRFENRDAVLAEFPFPGGAAPALLVDAPGEHAVTAEWSLRAEARPDGVHAELRLPPCPASVVELDLPADRVLELNLPADRVHSAPAGVLIAGPNPADNPARRSWRVAAGARAALPLLIRKTGSAGAAFVLQKTIHKLSPDGLEAMHTFTAESLGDLRDLVLEHDPALRPIEVTGHDVEKWECRPGTPAVVAVRLRRPVRKFVLDVKALAPLPASAERGQPARWICPWMRLTGAVPRGEQLELHLDPRLEIGVWDGGDFLLAESSLLAGGTRRLTLQGGGVASGKGAPRRPSLAVLPSASFRAVQHSQWRLGPEGMQFASRLACRVRQGQLFRLAASVSPGWAVEAAETKPPGLLRSWSHRGRRFAAEFRRPLEPGDEPAILLRLRPDAPGPVAGRDLPFPDLVPLGARHREGGLAIDWDEQAFRGAARTAFPPGDVPADAPGLSPFADLYYPFQGEAPQGVLRLEPRAPRLAARADVDVSVGGGRAVEEIRVVLEAEGGLPAWAEVRLSGPPVEWRTESGTPPRSIERRPDRDLARALAVLAARTPLEAAML
ncbi:MAG: hypothetical protein K2W96_23765, partial [Gemmataceae bacterium]|nr:hypothetical protein [Gemmataceae bacterium]